MPGIDPSWNVNPPQPPIEPTAPSLVPNPVTPTNLTPEPLPISEPRFQGPIWATLKTSGIFIASALVVYLFIVGPSLWVKGQYILTHWGSRSQPQQVVNTKSDSNSLSGSAITSALAALPAVENPPGDGTNNQNRANSEPQATLASAKLGLADNLLVINKLNIHAPIMWNSSSDETTMMANLQKGVVHYGFTQLPNEKDGNVFIAGHSSYYWWDKGQYKTVFATLDQLVAGDQAMIQYQNKIFVYEVTGKVTVKPNDVSVAEATPEPRLSLMTCVPIGTAMNRLVVQAKLVRTYAAEVQQNNSSIIPTAQAAELPASTSQTTVPAQSSPSTNTNNRDSIKLLPGF